METVKRKDKKIVVGEFFDDDRVRSFLHQQAPEGYNADFYILERAYRGMQEENFSTFVRFFVESGHDLHATNPDGKTLYELISQHERSEGYAEILKKAETL